MTVFEKLVLRGLWLILKQLMRNSKYTLDTDEVAWCREVSETTDDDSLSASNFAKMIRP